MSDETIWKQSSRALAISGTTNLASNGFVGSAEVTSLSSAQTGKYPLADGAFNGSFSTSISIASNFLVLYRRDLNIDGTNDAPQPQSAAPAYSNIQVGMINLPPFTAGSIAVTIPFENIPLPAHGDCEFYIENKTNATLLSGWTFKVTPKTYAPAP